MSLVHTGTPTKSQSCVILRHLLDATLITEATAGSLSPCYMTLLQHPRSAFEFESRDFEGFSERSIFLDIQVQVNVSSRLLTVCYVL